MKQMIPDPRGIEYGRFIVERTPEQTKRVTWECAEDIDRSYSMEFNDEGYYEAWRAEHTSGVAPVTLWYVVGPDDLTDGEEYLTRQDAEAAMGRFLARYERQGYYKDVRGRRLTMEALANRTRITTEEP